MTRKRNWYSTQYSETIAVRVSSSYEGRLRMCVGNARTKQNGGLINRIPALGRALD